ncbi:MAG: bifunctional phosphopantothenoylcysteine decarboxylase/phosphopantothenate--cysteine ligase CoaBC [Deltaproteobacteria bacterium]|nr:bifunctional phosphopantothenoylcysteine decarboxylase/phosphopantothenate--cysteine ligase CoaBC [Deltaproteobacteria bacterium]
MKDKQIVLGICGGIAAYKAAEFLRLLVTSGANVRVIMTEAAERFVGEVTFGALSGSEVWTHMFDRSHDGFFRHIEWASNADAVVIIPATANVIGKMAHGIADDCLTTFILAVKAPVLVCPSMNVYMYENSIVQDNIDRLRLAGMHIMSPSSGSLACGQEGIGRLADIETILEQLRGLLAPKDLKGERILVTAGPTMEAIDPVRFISNPSSGKMGYALAHAARRRGAEVVLVSGPTTLSASESVTVIKVTTAQEMFDAVMSQAETSSIIIKAAAVCDWRPARYFEHKVKKKGRSQQLDLEKTEDILKKLGEGKTDQILVGFAAETENLSANAGAKLAAKNLDMIVANLVGHVDSGFGSDTNRVMFAYKDGKSESLSLMDKNSLADIILGRVLQIKKGRRVGME